MPRTAAAKKPVAIAAAPARNLFDTAALVPAKPAPKASDRTLTKEMMGLRDYVALSETTKTVAALALLDGIALQASIYDHFITEGCRTGQIPANFRGVEGEASASMQLRMKTSNQPLGSEAVAMLAEAGVTLGTNVVQVGTFIVNPEYVGNTAMMARAGVAFGAAVEAAGLPDDFMLRQPEVSTIIVIEQTLLDIFRRYGNKPEAARLLLETVAFPLISGKWGGDPDEATNLVRDRLFKDADLPDAEKATTKAKVIEKAKEAQRQKDKAAATQPALPTLKEALVASLAADAKAPARNAKRK